jgi:uncharacterized protein YndB with AHSA1/START domain
MAETIHDSFTIERSYPHGRDKVFAAISGADRKPAWFAVGRHASAVFDIDFRVGGREFQRYILGDDTPFPGTAIENEGRYEDIVPGERIVQSSTTTFGGKRISSALITYELFEEAGATRLRLTHQAVFYEGADGPDMRKGGWAVLIDNLSAVLDA